MTGNTAEYERLETGLTAAGYEPSDFSFRWRQRDGLHLEVEFFCAASEDRPAGRMFRPKATINPTAKHNFGPKLTAIALDAGGVIEADVHEVEVDVDLPHAAGRTKFTFRVPGLLGFLAAKTAALTGRDKPKDAYDIVWILENWPEGPAAAAAAIRDSPAFGRPDASQMVDRLFEEFSSLDGLGPPPSSASWPRPRPHRTSVSDLPVKPSVPCTSFRQRWSEVAARVIQHAAWSDAAVDPHLAFTGCGRGATELDVR